MESIHIFFMNYWYVTMTIFVFGFLQGVEVRKPYTVDIIFMNLLGASLWPIVFIMRLMIGEKMFTED